VAEHRRHQRSPEDVLRSGFGLAIGYAWSPASFAKHLGQLGTAKVEITPGGRRLKAKGLSPVEATRQLAAALLPLANKYPLPFLESSG
jgi:hypothetical protein